MRLGWRVRLFGPFTLGGTIWRTKTRRKPAQTRKWPILDCGHAHRSREAYDTCVRRSKVAR